VADQIARFARRSGDVAARYGGEEFVLLYPATTTSQALQLAQDLLACMQQTAIPHPDSPLGAYITLSIGIAVLTPSQGVAPELALDQADRALYEAKLSGRNRSVLFEMGEAQHPAPTI
jgi:diguanylate cyclase (GGDEF)-like protein